MKRKSRGRPFLAAAVIVWSGTAQGAPSTPRFEKDASRFCFSALDAREQSRLFSRVLSLGASFTHGCMSCDHDPAQSAHNEMSDDLYWARRQYVIQFLAHAPWKDPRQFRFDGFAILENDPQSRPAALIPAETLSKDGYSGLWHYDHLRDQMTRLDASTFSAYKRNPLFSDETPLIGGVETRRDMNVRPGWKKGVWAHTIVKGIPDVSATPRTLIDFSTDGARMIDLFRVHGDPSAFAAVERSDWQDPSLRETLIASTAARLIETRPNLILAMDILFWDTIAHTLSLVRDARPESLTVRFLVAILARSPAAKDIFNELRRRTISESFYTALERVSVGGGQTEPAPLLLGRMLDTPSDLFRRPAFRPVVGALLGQFVHHATGRNFAVEFTRWLRRLGTVETAPGTRVARTVPFEDPLTGELVTVDDAARAREAYARYESTAVRYLKDFGVTIKSLEDLAPDAVASPPGAFPFPDAPGDLAERRSARGQRSYRPDPGGGGALRGPPSFMGGILSFAILEALSDLPTFLRQLDVAMAISNEKARAVTLKSENNIHLVNVDPFLANFPKFLKPETMHPSVYGAREMAALIDGAICASRGPQ